MADVPDAVACPPSQSVISRRQTEAGAEGESASEAFAAATAAAREAKEPPATSTSHAGSLTRVPLMSWKRRNAAARIFLPANAAADSERPA